MPPEPFKPFAPGEGVTVARYEDGAGIWVGRLEDGAKCLMMDVPEHGVFGQVIDDETVDDLVEALLCLRTSGAPR